MAIALLEKEANIPPPYKYILKPLQYKGRKKNVIITLFVL